MYTVLDKLAVLCYSEYGSCLLYYYGGLWGNAKNPNYPNLQNFEKERVISNAQKNFLGAKKSCEVALCEGVWNYY